MLAQLQTAGHEGIRVIPNNLVAAGELVKQDQAHAYPNGFGYLCLRAACESKNAAGLEMICPAGGALLSTGNAIPAGIALALFVPRRVCLGTSDRSRSRPYASEERIPLRLGEAPALIRRRRRGYGSSRRLR